MPNRNPREKEVDGYRQEYDRGRETSNQGVSNAGKFVVDNDSGSSILPIDGANALKREYPEAENGKVDVSLEVTNPHNYSK